MSYVKTLPELEDLKKWFDYDPEKGTLFSKRSNRFINSNEVRLPHPTNSKYKRRTAIVCYKMAHGIEPKIVKYLDGNKLNWKAENLVDRILTFDQIKKIASKYDSKTEFYEQNLSAHQQLHKSFSKAEQDEICKHMVRKDFVSRRKEVIISDELRNSIQVFIAELKKRKHSIRKSDFALKNGSPLSNYKIKKIWGSYLYFAEEFGISDKFNGPKVNPLTYEECVNKATQCKTMIQFIENYQSIYDYARYRGWLDSIVEDANLTKRLNYKEKSDEELINLANSWCKDSNCTSPAEFRKSGAGLAAELWRRQLHRNVELLEFGEYYPEGTTKFSLAEIKETAESCASISEFVALYSGMYSTVRRQGWQDEVFENVGRVYTKPNILYFWNCLEIPNVWKIGISNNNPILGRHRLRWRYRVSIVAAGGDLTPDQIYHTTLQDPKSIEQLILSTYPSFTWGKQFDGSTEFLHLSKSESDNIINQYFS